MKKWRHINEGGNGTYWTEGWICGNGPEWVIRRSSDGLFMVGDEVNTFTRGELVGPFPTLKSAKAACRLIYS